MSINKIYERYKEEFNRTGWHPHPRKLLALLLLERKNEMMTNLSHSRFFYNEYENIIRSCIDKVIVDFAITEAELIKLTAEFSDDDYIDDLINGDQMYDKDWVFYYGYDIVRVANKYFRDASGQKIYSIFSKILNNRMGFFSSCSEFPLYANEDEMIENFKELEKDKMFDVAISLNDRYNQYREEYIETGIRPNPGELLILLMLQEKEKYPVSKNLNDEFNFLSEYLKEIDKYAKKVEEDFNISEEEILKVLVKDNDEEKRKMFQEETSTYTIFKICFYFRAGYRIVELGNRHHPNGTAEEIYCLHFEYPEEDMFESKMLNKPTVLKRIMGCLKRRGQGVK